MGSSNRDSVVVTRSRGLDDNDIQPKYSQTEMSSERSLAVLEKSGTRPVNPAIQALKAVLQYLSRTLSQACERLQQPLKEYTVTLRLFGTVMGHEKEVLKYLQDGLKDHVKLVIVTSGEHAAVTLQFHRMKQRLPADELAAVLAASAGVPSKLVVVFMHNIPNGHEKHMRPAGLNNTDLECWQHFVQQCHKVINMTFDEVRRMEWHDINSAAAQAIIDVVKETAESLQIRSQDEK